MVEDRKLWNVISDGKYVPMKAVKVGDVTSMVPRTQKEFEEGDKNKIEKNYKAKKLLVYVNGFDEYHRIFSCEFAKEI